MNPEDVTQLRELFKINKRRLHVLEQQAATMGGHCPPHIITEIEDIQERINTFEHQLNNDVAISYIEGKKIATQFSHELDNIKENIQKVGFIEKTEYRIFGIPVLSISRVITSLMLLLALGGILFISRLVFQISSRLDAITMTQVAIISTKSPTIVTPELVATLPVITQIATEPAIPEAATQTTEPIIHLPIAAPNTIRIALQSPQSGEWSAIGIGIAKGAELAISQQSRPITNLGYKVEFIPFDDGGNSDLGRANAQAIVADPATLCVVGHFNSGVTLATQPIYASANLVQISPGSTNPAVTDSNDTVWRLVGRDDVQGIVAAQFAREALKSQRAYVIDDSTLYGRSIANIFRNDATVNGPQVVGSSSYDDSKSEVDFTPFISDVKALNPDLIYFAGSYSRAAVFFKQVREGGSTAQFLGSDSLDNPELGRLAGAAVNGVHFTSLVAPIARLPRAQQFAQDYRAKYQEDATPFSAEAYDATTLCIQAIARASLNAAGREPTRAEVLQAMRTLSSFEGISGNYRFNSNGDPELAIYFIVEVNGENWSKNKVVDAILARPPS